MTVVVGLSRLQQWVRLWQVFKGLVDADLMPLYVAREPDDLLARGRFLLERCAGVLDVRAVAGADVPPADPLDIGEGVVVGVSLG